MTLHTGIVIMSPRGPENETFSLKLNSEKYIKLVEICIILHVELMKDIRQKSTWTILLTMVIQTMIILLGVLRKYLFKTGYFKTYRKVLLKI